MLSLKKKMATSRKHHTGFLAIVACTLMSAEATIMVNSLQDVEVPAQGRVTLRSALNLAASGEPIVFDPALNGCTIKLSIVGQEHSTLVAELMGGRETPSGYVSYLIGYEERDYGRSALYARKNVVIDASSLPLGITIKWTPGDANPARVLAVYGNLTLKNVSITGGRSVSEELVVDESDIYPQKSTRARGGGLAVWGVAHLENCRLYNNACSQVWSMPIRDSREGGVFGGGLYADVVQVSDCVFSGNSLSGAGVSGGGVFSVGGRSSNENQSIIERSALTGNAIAGIFAYGGGVYSDGGGIGKLKELKLVNCTVANNQVGIYGPGFLYGSGYWRGGGVYMSNGYMVLQSCTIVGNAVTGVERTDDLGKTNLAGGVVATIGNAHAVESMTIGHCIITGNMVYPFGGSAYNEDIFTGSLFEFISKGFNRIGVINFDQMLVPVGKKNWHSLCRRHYPKLGDQNGILTADVLDLTSGTVRSADILSVGVDAAQHAVLRYMPRGTAVDQVPGANYSLTKTWAEYETHDSREDKFTEIILNQIENVYGLTDFKNTFTANFEAFLESVDIDDETAGNQPYTDPDGNLILTLSNTLWYGPQTTWPSQLANYPYIEFWHQLDTALKAENIHGMGPELLGDDAWRELFDDSKIIEEQGIKIDIWTVSYNAQLAALDQTGAARPADSLGDIGAIEYHPPSPEQLPDIDSDGDEIFDLIDMDNDNDGLSDAGELAIGTDPNDPDSDGDGSDDQEEVLAGTNPNDGSSLFKCKQIDTAPSGIMIYWSSESHRTYSLWGSESLSPDSWNLIKSGIPNTTPVNVYKAERQTNHYFFRIEVE